MPIKLADTLAPMGNFPAVESDNVDITIEGSPKSLQQAYEDGDLGGGGSSIQVETMPAASAENVGKIVQYVGETGTYQKGHFYECILAHNGTGSTYAWEDVDHLRFNHVVYHCTVPPVNEECKPGDIIYYSGKTMGNFKNGYYYRAIPNATPQQHYGVTFWTTPSSGTGYLCYTPFELRIGFIVYPTGTGGTSYPYEITDFDDTGITITPYGWSGEDRHYIGVYYTETVQGWEELEGGGGTSIFYGTMDEWNALSADEKKQYDYMADDDENSDLTDFVTNIADTEANKLLNAQGGTTDCNTTIKAGVYSCAPQTANRPSGVDYGVLMVFGQRTDFASPSVQWIYQFFYETAGRIYKRYCINPSTLTPSSSQWTAWEIIAGGVEQVSNPFTVNTSKATSAFEVEALKQGRVVQFKVYIESFKNIVSETWNTLGTVADAIKPVMETPLSISDGRVVNASALTRITTNGELQIWGTDALNTLSSRFFATYFSVN